MPDFAPRNKLDSNSMGRSNQALPIFTRKCISPMGQCISPMGQADNGLLAQLDEFVRAYRSDSFCLGNDLTHLMSVRDVQAPEAMVLYCGRILEVLSGSALLDIKLSPSQPFANLCDLERFNLIPQITLFLAHGLRRVANSARHINYPLTPFEADVVLVYLERWMHWYFCCYEFGPRRKSLAAKPEDMHLSTDALLRQFVLNLESVNPKDKAALQSLIACGGMIWEHSSSVASILAELLIEQKEFDSAKHVLDSALKAFPEELRLLQLRALWFSRKGEPDQAVETLNGLTEDEETVGILGGALKRLWEKDGKQALLEKCYATYRNGWDRSKKSNVYLGINAATTALWLKKEQKTHEIATKVRDILNDRQNAITKLAGKLRLGFWDELTVAEANLLLGDLDAAQKIYVAALRETHKIGNREVAEKQARKILEAQGKSAAVVAAFLEPLRSLATSL
jgi:tetratricopeptide (TPR) repeat protein